MRDIKNRPSSRRLSTGEWLLNPESGLGNRLSQPGPGPELAGGRRDDQQNIRHFATRLALWLLLLCAGASFAFPALLSPLQQSEWRRREAALNAMTPAQRAAFEQRIAQWDALPESVRRARRERAHAWRTLPANERAQVTLAATVFATLPPEQQQALRNQFDALDGRDRHGWLLGPVLGADYPRLQSLLSYVPAKQQSRLMQVLRAMTVAERADLAVLAQRTPPEGRDALRRALLSTSAGNRTVWLQSQLDR